MDKSEHGVILDEFYLAFVDLTTPAIQFRFPRVAKPWFAHDDAEGCILTAEQETVRLIHQRIQIASELVEQFLADAVDFLHDRVARLRCSLVRRTHAFPSAWRAWKAAARP